MSKTRLRAIIENTVGIGYFPHQVSFLLHNPIRRLLIAPKELAERLPLKPTSRVLEVGPGSGYFSVEIARRVPRGHLELLDLQPEMLEKARHHLEAAGLENVGYTQADASSLPFPDADFDIAFLVAVLGEVPDDAACLQSLYRVLRPGGVAVFHEHLPDPDFSPLGQLREVVEAQGFVFLESWGRRWNYTASFQKPAGPRDEAAARSD
jgi:ubiquinone/menaquinone biosynthesis C-methylase UbiE